MGRSCSLRMGHIDSHGQWPFYVGGFLPERKKRLEAAAAVFVGFVKKPSFV